MARHKKIEVEEQGDPEMNISSLIDCCFLLLIYFLVATTLVSEKKIDMAMPSSSPSDGAPPPLEPGRIEIKADGSVLWGSGASAVQVGPASVGIDPASAEYRDVGRLSELVDNLKTLKDNAKAVDAEPIIMLNSNGSTPHQRVVDVMSALAEAGIQSVGLETSIE